MKQPRGAPPVWPPLAFLALIPLLIILVSRAVPGAYDRFVGPYIWRPMVRDEEFNLVNTTVLILVLIPLAVWIYRMLQRHGVRIDLALVLATLLLQPAGAMLRTLEDSDYFAPYDQRVQDVRPDLGEGATCVKEVGGGLLHECLGLAFVTPPIYVLLVLMLGGIGRLAFAGESYAKRTSIRDGSRFFALTLVAGYSLTLAWIASEPTYVRMRIPYAWATVCFAAGAITIEALRHRLARHDWRAALFAYCLILFLLVGYPLVAWILGGVGHWHAEQPTNLLVLVAGVVGALTLVSLLRLNIRLATRRAKRTFSEPTTWLAAYVLLTLVALGLFFAVLYVSGVGGRLPRMAVSRNLDWILTPVTFAALVTAIAYHVGRSRSAHPSLHVLGDPMNLLLMFGQYLDALMTSIGLDVYAAQEKHVLPRTLVAAFDSLSLPALVESFPTLFAFVPYKLAFVLLLIWVLDVRYRERFLPWPNVSWLVKSIAILVGLSPGLRDAIRLAMGV